jgi:hypothetical protein
MEINELTSDCLERRGCRPSAGARRPTGIGLFGGPAQILRHKFILRGEIMIERLFVAGCRRCDRLHTHSANTMSGNSSAVAERMRVRAGILTPLSTRLLISNGLTGTPPALVGFCARWRSTGGVCWCRGDWPARGPTCTIVRINHRWRVRERGYLIPHNIMSAYHLDNSVGCRPDISNPHSDGCGQVRLCPSPRERASVTHSWFAAHRLSSFLIDPRNLSYGRSAVKYKTVMARIMPRF